MYVIYNKDKGFICEDEDKIGGWDYDYELDEYTVTYPTLDSAINNCDIGDVVLKVEYHTYA